MFSKWFKKKAPNKIEVKLNQEFIHAGEELSGNLYITAGENDICTESITLYHGTTFFDTSYSLLNRQTLYSRELPNCEVAKKQTKSIPFTYHYPKNGPWTIGFRPYLFFVVKIKGAKTVNAEVDLMVHPHPSVATILEVVDSNDDFKVYKASIETMLFLKTRFKDMPDRYVVGDKRLHQQVFNLTEYQFLNHSFMFRWVRFVFSVTEEGVDILLMPQLQPIKERYNIHFFVKHDDSKEEIMMQIHKHLRDYSEKLTNR